MRTIVTLIDLADVSDKVLGHTQRLATILGANVVLIHVVSEEGYRLGVYPTSPQTEREQRELADADFKRLCDRSKILELTGVSFRVEQVTRTKVIRAVAAHEPEFVIIGAHYHDVSVSGSVGSFDSKMLSKMRWPVVVIPVMPIAPYVFKAPQIALEKAS